MAAGIDSIDYCNEMSQRRRGFKNSHGKKLHLPTDSCKCTIRDYGCSKFYFPPNLSKIQSFQSKISIFWRKKLPTTRKFHDNFPMAQDLGWGNCPLVATTSLLAFTV